MTQGSVSGIMPAYCHSEMKVNIHGVSHDVQRVLPPPGGHNGQIVEAPGERTRRGNYVTARSAQKMGKKNIKKLKWLRPHLLFGSARLKKKIKKKCADCAGRETRANLEETHGFGSIRVPSQLELE